MPFWVMSGIGRWMDVLDGVHFGIFHHLIHPSFDRRHPELISRFYTVHSLDRQTDRWAKRQLCSNTHLRFIDCIATWLIITRTIWYCHHGSLQSHCESSPGSSYECRLSAGWPPTLRPNQPTWTENWQLPSASAFSIYYKSSK